MQITSITANYKQQNKSRVTFGNVCYSKMLKNDPLNQKVLDKILETPAVKKIIGVYHEELHLESTFRPGDIRGRYWQEGMVTDSGCAVPKVFKFVVKPETTEQQIENYIEEGRRALKADPFIWNASYDAGLLKRASIGIRKFINNL